MASGLSVVLNNSNVPGHVARHIPHLSTSGRGELMRRIADAAAVLLDLDLVNLVVQTLRTYEALIAAAKRTAAAPGSVEVVHLLSVPTSWQTRAIVQLCVNDVPCTKIELRIDIVLEIELEATVKYGRLVALPSGRCTTSLTLSGQGVSLLAGRVVLDLPTEVPFRNGIPLIPM